MSTIVHTHGHTNPDAHAYLSGAAGGDRRPAAAASLVALLLPRDAFLSAGAAAAALTGRGENFSKISLASKPLANHHVRAVSAWECGPGPCCCCCCEEGWSEGPGAALLPAAGLAAAC
jgi:hypothetical protein